MYQDFLFGEDGKEYELVGKFSRFCISISICISSVFVLVVDLICDYSCKVAG